MLLIFPAFLIISAWWFWPQDKNFYAAPRPWWQSSPTATNTEPVTLLWNFPGHNTEIIPDVGKVHAVGSVKVLPRETTTYKLIADGKVVATCKVKRRH